MILGIDVGGTFTDFVLLDDAGRIRSHKLLTSVRDQSKSILQGIADLEVGQEATVVHGATVATKPNAVQQTLAPQAVAQAQALTLTEPVQGTVVATGLPVNVPPAPTAQNPSPQRPIPQGVKLTKKGLPAICVITRIIMPANVDLVIISILFRGPFVTQALAGCYAIAASESMLPPVPESGRVGATLAPARAVPGDRPRRC